VAKKMAYDAAVYHADDLRRRGEITWEEYGNLLRGKLKSSPSEYMKEMALGLRDRDGRLKELQDLGGR
jgi:hypothetical protein